MQENYTIVNRRRALDRPTFPVNPLLFWSQDFAALRFLDCREIHRVVWVLWETFLNARLFKKDEPLQSSTIRRIRHPLLKNWDMILQRQEGKKESGKGNRWMRLFNDLTSKAEVDRWITLVELILTVVWWIIREFLRPNGILENFLTLRNFKAGSATSELRFVNEQPILRSPCSGSKKLRLLNQLTNLWHRDRLEESLIFMISICLMRWLRQPWRSISARKTNCVHDLWVFPCNRVIWSSTRTRRFVRYKFTERRCPRFRC